MPSLRDFAAGQNTTSQSSPFSTFTASRDAKVWKPITPARTTPAKSTVKPLSQDLFKNTNSIVKITDTSVKGRIFTGLKRIQDRFKAAVQQTKGGFEGTAGLITSKVEQKLRTEGDKVFKERAKRNPEIYDEQFFKERNQKLETIRKTSDTFKKKGIETEGKAIKDIQKIGPAPTKFQWVVEEVVGATPSFLASLGIGAVTSLITKNPVLGVSLGFSSSFTQEAGSAYLDAKRNGASETVAENAGVTVGVVNGVIEQIPLIQFLNDIPGGKSIKKKIMTVFKQALSEGSTEGVQQIWSNAVARTYDANRSFFEGVPESLLIGGILGSGTGAVGGLIVKEDGDIAEVIDTANTKIQTALNTEPESRTPEQIEIVNTLLTENLTPKEAIAVVAVNNLENTEEGKVIVKNALQANEEGKNLEIKAKEDTGELEISIVDDVVVNTKMPEDALINTYRENNKGKLLNIDDVREVYAPEGYNRINSNEYQDRATALGNKIFDQDIENLKPGDTFLFTAGSSGAGKSSALLDYPNMQQDITMGLDGNFSSKSSLNKLERVVKKGGKARIVFIYREPVDAWINGVVKRAVNPKNRRVVPSEIFLKNLQDSPTRVLEAYDKFGDKIEIEVIDNSHGKGKAKLIDNPIEFLRKISYNIDDVKRQITDYTNKGIKDGSISPETGEALLGEKTTGKSEQKSTSKQRDTVTSSLISEARKYPNAKDFVNAKINAYHGTANTFETFSKEFIGDNQPADFGDGFYFAKDKKTAKQYAKEAGGDIIMEVYIDLKNPAKNKDITDPDIQNAIDDGMGFKDVGEVLKEKGFDGIEYTRKDGRIEYTVYDPSQIKTRTQLTDIYNEAVTADADTSLLESEQAREVETRDTSKAQKTRAEIDKLKENVEMIEQDKAVKRSILDQFTGRQIQIMRILKRSINKRVEAGRDPITIEETPAYKDHIRDIMSALKKGEDDIVSEGDAIYFIQNELPDAIIDADTKEELEKIQVLQSRLTPKEVKVQQGILPVGEGKPKLSKMEARLKGIIENATPEQIEELGTSIYNTMNKKEQINMALEYVADHKTEAIEIIEGKRRAPEGLIPESIYIALTELSKGDLTLVTKLASLQATALGQRISILTELDRDNPVKLLNEVYKIREERFKRRYKDKPVKEFKEKTIKEIKKAVKKPDRYDWNTFISSIQC